MVDVVAAASSPSVIVVDTCEPDYARTSDVQDCPPWFVRKREPFEE
jgi:hypothetical protein